MELYDYRAYLYGIFSLLLTFFGRVEVPMVPPACLWDSGKQVLEGDIRKNY